MNQLLKAMGFWVWGLVAIGLSVSLVSVSYRMLSVYRPTRNRCQRTDCGA